MESTGVYGCSSVDLGCKEPTCEHQDVLKVSDPLLNRGSSAVQTLNRKDNTYIQSTNMGSLNTRSFSHCFPPKNKRRWRHKKTHEVSDHSLSKKISMFLSTGILVHFVQGIKTVANSQEMLFSSYDLCYLSLEKI